ncbi:hypothetical protein WMY93_033254, partial [Mugilogobius chulae]
SLHIPTRLLSMKKRAVYLIRETEINLDRRFISDTNEQIKMPIAVKATHMYAREKEGRGRELRFKSPDLLCVLSLHVLPVRERQVKQLQTNSSGKRLRGLSFLQGFLSTQSSAAGLYKMTQTCLQKVAFSVGLSDSGAVGPFDSETVLKFSQILTNHGSAYDPQTGFFSAPVPGLFFFSFCVADFVKGYMGVSLYHNDRPISFSLSLNAHGGYDSVCNSALLRLEAGDTVSLRLPASYRLYDDQRRFSLFSGFGL